MQKHQTDHVNHIKTICTIGCIIGTLLFVACAPTAKNAIQVSSLNTQEHSYPQQEYRIQPHDLLDVKFFYNSELNEKTPVRPDGRISLQLAHEVMAAGRTAAGLTEELTRLYSAQLKQTKITVIVRTFNSQKVYVSGEVNSPQLVDLKGMLTVLHAISEAGGFRDTARINEVIVIRRRPDNKPIAIQLDIEKIINGTDTNQDIPLIPFDIVYVPRSPIANVNLWVDQYIRKVLPFDTDIGLYYNTD